MTGFPWHRTRHNSEGGLFSSVVSMSCPLALVLLTRRWLSSCPVRPPWAAAVLTRTALVLSAPPLWPPPVSTAPHPSQGPGWGNFPESRASLHYRNTNSLRRMEGSKYPFLAPEPLGTKQSIHRVNKISLNQRAHHHLLSKSDGKGGLHQDGVRWTTAACLIARPCYNNLQIQPLL